MTFKTTLRKALDRADCVTLIEETSFGQVEHKYVGRSHADDTVSFILGEDRDSFGPFRLDQEIEIEDYGRATLVAMLDDDAEPGEEPVEVEVYFERTVPLNASHLEN